MWSQEALNSHIYFPLLLSSLNILLLKVLLIIVTIRRYNVCIKNSRKLINHIINNWSWSLTQAIYYLFHTIFTFHYLIIFKLGAIFIFIVQMRCTRLGNFLPASRLEVWPEPEPGLTPKPISHPLIPLSLLLFHGAQSRGLPTWKGLPVWAEFVYDGLKGEEEQRVIYGFK